MNTLRLKEARKATGLTQRQVADIIGISQNNYSYWENGKIKIDSVSLQRLSELFNVSTDFLLGRSAAPAPVLKNEIEINDCFAIPLVGRVVAGVPIESAENLEGYILIDRKPKDEYFALRVNGDSMINAGIRHNSILIVHKQAHAENGDIVVAFLNGEQTVKRFKIYGNSLFLMPENPDYEPIHICPDANFFILGKVVEVRIVF